ncbi:DUF3592 domain-containing protein [Acidovorax sp. LjRoot194]|uniref:DUF3592 domain-containing protein n=1 Tax=Acidovorax sp. LjRoot194 TaxID=3342280 RepID=UPI003ECDB28F
MPQTITSNRENASPRAWLVLALFGLSLAAVALVFVFAAIVPTLYDGWRMRSWQPVPARLVDAAIETHGSARRKTTYSVRAEYVYEVGGVRRTGSRPAINGGADDIGHFHYGLGVRLQQALQAGEPVTAYVNLAQPAQSVLDRTIRWNLLGFWMIFVAAFGGVGGTLMAWALRNYRRGANASTYATTVAGGAIQGLAPVEGSLGGPISAHQKLETMLLAGFAAIALPLSVWMCLRVLPRAWQGEPAAWVVLMFPLVAAGLLRAVYKRARMRQRFGDAQLVLSPLPARQGEPFMAHVDIRAAYRPSLRYAARLQCLRNRTTRIGDEVHTTEQVEWSASARARVSDEGSGMLRLQWRLQVPHGLPASTEPGILWRLEIHDEHEAQGYRAQFLLPMVDAADAAERGPAPAGQSQGTQVLADDEGRMPGADPFGAVCSMQAVAEGGAQLEQPAGRMWRAQRILILTVCLVGVPLLLAVSATAPPALRLAAFLAAGMAVAWALFAVGNRRSSYLNAQQGIRTERRLLGLRTSFQQVPADQVQQLAIRLAYTQSLGDGPREEIYTLYAQLHGGASVVLADSISGQPAARQALREVARVSGFAAAG